MADKTSQFEKWWNSKECTDAMRDGNARSFGQAAYSAEEAANANDLKLRGISYCPDLAEEGTPWEAACEPEPQYFATLLEAYDFQIELALRAAAATQCPNCALAKAVYTARYGWVHPGKDDFTCCDAEKILALLPESQKEPR